MNALGHQTDPETGGLIYMQARYYDPSTGRFVSEDPGRNGENWYAYGADCPTCNVDTNGTTVYRGAAQLSMAFGLGLIAAAVLCKSLLWAVNFVTLAVIAFTVALWCADANQAETEGATIASVVIGAMQSLILLLPEERQAAAMNGIAAVAIIACVQESAEVTAALAAGNVDNLTEPN